MLSSTREMESPLGCRDKNHLFLKVLQCHLSLQSLFQGQMVPALLPCPQWTESIRSMWLLLPFSQLSAYLCRVEVVSPRAKSVLCIITGELFSCHSSPLPISSLASTHFLLRNLLDMRETAKYQCVSGGTAKDQKGEFLIAENCCVFKVLQSVQF